MQKDAAFLLEQEVKQMRLDLQRETVDLAVAAAGELLKKRVTPEDQERMAEEFLKTLTLPRAQPAPKATT
jgi:F0F1-type ATP synthase membrane subunit b/b'